MQERVKTYQLLCENPCSSKEDVKSVDLTSPRSFRLQDQLVEEIGDSEACCTNTPRDILVFCDVNVVVKVFIEMFKSVSGPGVLYVQERDGILGSPLRVTIFRHLIPCNIEEFLGAMAVASRARET
jgi:hypothetical protein